MIIHQKNRRGLPPFKAAAFCLALLAAGHAGADGFTDLRAALARDAGQAPLRAALDLKTLERRGKGEDLDEKIGDASAIIEDGPRGLQMTFSKDTLARMDAESRQQGRNPNARTPTLWALTKLDPGEQQAMLSAASALARALDESTFRSEKADAWQGRPARVLSFDLPIGKLPKEQRKYVRQFDGTLRIWIADDGTPLGSAMRENVAGRAFIVISFEVRNDEDCTYGRAGDRLLMLRRETHLVSSGAGERGEQRVVRTLQVLP